MRINLLILILTILASAGLTAAQCKSTEQVAVWDGNKQDFVCKSASSGGAPEDHSAPMKIIKTEKDRQDFCDLVLANLLRACPRGAKGIQCRQKAQARIANCLHGTGGGGAGGAGGDTGFPLRTDPKACQQEFQIQINACRRKHRIRRVGEPEDTCKADARAALKDCLGP